MMNQMLVGQDDLNVLNFGPCHDVVMKVKPLINELQRWQLRDTSKLLLMGGFGLAQRLAFHLRGLAGFLVPVLPAR